MKFSSLSPSLGENYRCMLVWDTRTNKDVGWVMVRKTSMWKGWFLKTWWLASVGVSGEAGMWGAVRITVPVKYVKTREFIDESKRESIPVVEKVDTCVKVRGSSRFHLISNPGPAGKCFDLTKNKGGEVRNSNGI